MITELLHHFLKALFADNDYRSDIELDTLSKDAERIVVRDAKYINGDKVRQMRRLYEDVWSVDSSSRPTCGVSNPFIALWRFADTCLTMRDGKVAVMFEELLRWRKLSTEIGENLLVCAYLAHEDCFHGSAHAAARWGYTCQVDDVDLKYIFSKGLSELHQHLKASADMFSLSWICLMNHITRRYLTFGKIAGGNVPEVYRQCYEAAALRVRLFEILQGMEETEYEMPDSEAGFESALKKLQYRINGYRECYGWKIRGKRYDYAITSNLSEELTPLNVFDGEKYILYASMLRVFQNPADKKLTQMLYKYVLAKSKFRQFIEQNNVKKGFANFSIYERRKDIVLDSYSAYKRIALALAAEESLSLHHVTSLETRIAPKNDLRKMLADFLRAEKYCRATHCGEEQDVRFVYHFIKRCEEDTREGFVRHHRLRNDVKRQTLNIVVMQRYKKTVYEKLVGVDAANSELGCRPEVFAQSFRYLRKHCDGRLHFTYHAGEDFYDIADGLRAIDEAVRLLHLGNGERIGHGLALGTVAHYYYHRQEGIIAISKQCLLDNCAWLLARCPELGISIAPKVRHTLESYYCRLLAEIYDRHDVLHTYINSMLLRGDNPRALQSGDREVSDVIPDWKSCDLDPNPQLVIARQNIDAVNLYLDYHFSEKVKKEGNRIEEFKITDEYEHLITEIQEVMMTDIERRGIVMECCPSSNFKIGYEDRYDYQPVFRFNDIADTPEGHHIPVTINTDDIGVFHTTLDNEYAILALAALKKKDAEGCPLYSRRMVMTWLDHLRESGFKYRFSI
ncbi:MAG: hypothetical protein ACI3Y0_06825 [Prevotella sp.]